jgi:putative oxidoreductase
MCRATPSPPGQHPMNRDNVRTVAKSVALWIPVVLLAIIFVPQGWAKFSDTSGWARAFAHWGDPVWFRVTIGVVELAAIALLLWRRTAALGAVLIVCLMLGGMGTHVVKDQGRHMTSEVVPLILAVVVFVTRFRRPPA